MQGESRKGRWEKKRKREEGKGEEEEDWSRLECILYVYVKDIYKSERLSIVSHLERGTGEAGD